MTVLVAAFYKFTPIADAPALRDRLQADADAAGVRGTILVAPEGVNGTISGAADAVRGLLRRLQATPGLGDLDWKESVNHEPPFHRMKVRLKREIVSMGVDGVDPENSHRNYVAPADWNALISDPDTVVIDTRNDYEVAIGAFEGAINPQIGSFREFPDWFRRFRREHPTTRVAMYCTGGIRCEKSTALARLDGVAEVFHLKGGILKYLEETPPEESLWRGECFVFDQRVSVDHKLQRGGFDQCHACRRPIDDADKASPDYREGVSCPHCAGDYSEARRNAFAERQKQVELARARGEAHIGAKDAGAAGKPAVAGKTDA